MISTFQVIAIAFAYVCLLFFIAWYSDNNKPSVITGRRKALVYSFSLAIYCTSWTYYGAVGSAANTGWSYFPIYLGPILVYTLGWPFLRRFIQIGYEQNTTSISDFIASRFGKSQNVAAIVTLIAVVAIIPYIALQLKAITMSLEIFDLEKNYFSNLHLNSLVVTILLIGFSILFGTRSLDVTEHQYGMMNAIAFESLIKLLAFCSVGLFALFVIYDGPLDLYATIEQQPTLSKLWLNGINSENFIVQTLLSAVAIFCLPRQFHVSVVEYHQPADLSYSRWIFPGYLLIISFFVVPIVVSGSQYLAGTGINADSFILALPISQKQSLLSIIVFIGGFSAATGMVIVATVALSTMISNDLVLPFILHQARRQQFKDRQFSRRMLQIRRIAIAVCLLLSYGFYRVFDQSQSLASIGFLSFTAVLQFMPSVALGMFWQRATKNGAIAGLIGGIVWWLLLAWLPSFEGKNLVTDQGQILGMSMLSEAALISVVINCGLIVVVSAFSRQSIDEKVQAFAYSHSRTLPKEGKVKSGKNTEILIKDLKSLTAAIVGSERMITFFEQYEAISDNAIADKNILTEVEALLSCSIGAPSARAVIVSALKEKGKNVDEVINLLSSTSKALRFNRRLIESTIDTITQGISVVDDNKNIIAWNHSYEKLMKYPKGLLQIGMPIAELIRFNAERGFCGPGDIEEQVTRRLEHLDSGLAYRVERHRIDGVVLEIVGNPLPQGGYVTTYTDISEYKKIQNALIENERKIAIYTDNSPAHLAYLDTHYVFQFVNKTLANSLGLSKEKILGRAFSELVSKSEYDYKKTYLDDALKGKKQQFEYASESLDSSYYLITYLPDLDKRGRVTGIYTIAQDISNRRKAELALKEINVTLEQRVQMRTDELHSMVNALEVAKAEAEQANQSKSRFLAAASHDLLQPFSAARLYGEMLKAEAAHMTPQQAELVDKTEQSLIVAENIIRSLVDISKLDSGTMKADKQRIDLFDTLNAIDAQMQAVASKNGVALKVKNCHQYVYSDPKLLFRVLQNLVSNAIKYSPHGKVLVGVQSRGDLLRLSVWDNGIGIRQSDQEKIFAEFTQLSDPKIAATETGIGLGLSISQRLVEILGHQIDLSSNYGRGSAFHLWLKKDNSEDHVTAETNREEGNINKARAFDFSDLPVLCVDNEQQITDAMSMMLRRWGCQVKTAREEGQIEALLSDGFIPHILLVDYQLDNEKTGEQFIDKLRARLNINVPAVVITADHSAQLKERLSARGIKMLYKPVKPAVLRATMNSLLND